MLRSMRQPYLPATPLLQAERFGVLGAVLLRWSETRRWRYAANRNVLRRGQPGALLPDRRIATIRASVDPSRTGLRRETDRANRGRKTPKSWTCKPIDRGNSCLPARAPPVAN